MASEKADLVMAYSRSSAGNDPAMAYSRSSAGNPAQYDHWRNGNKGLYLVISSFKETVC